MDVKEILLESMVKDVGESIAFYTRALGFELLASEKDELGKVYWAKLGFKDFLISLNDEKRLRRESAFMRERPVGGSICLCIVVDEIINLHADFSQRFKLLDHPHLTPCGATQFSLLDNNGYVLTFEKFA